ncbi:MAG: hypothetical protein LBB72_09795 [Spirochaetaceae bacterium]|jgi:hypothetical protein|nr:hypothetical protein [Spirochaetaceae bacterium]
MKRFLCVFLAAVSVAALGFAQELKFDGYVNSGFGLWTSDEKGKDDPMVMAYGVDSERYIGRFRLNGAYTNEDKTAGINFRLQVQGRGFAPSSTLTTSTYTKSGSDPSESHNHTVSVTTGYPVNTPSLAFGYGWVKLLDMITIKAGLVDDSTWRTADYIYNDSQSEGAGLLVRITPVTGLDIGAGGYVATYNSGSNNNFLGVSLPSQIKMEDAKYTINAAYTMDKVFRFMVSGRTFNKTGGDSKYNRSHALAELRILAVDGLTAIVVGEMDNLHDDKANKDMNFYETFGYKMGDLGLGLNAAQYIRNLPEGSKAKNDLSVWINPWVSYALSEGVVVPRLDVVYFMGGNQDGQNYHRRGFAPNYDSEISVINARPSIKINVDSRASFEIGDSFYYYQPGKDIDAVMTNVVYADLVVRF